MRNAFYFPATVGIIGSVLLLMAGVLWGLIPFIIFFALIVWVAWP